MLIYLSLIESESERSKFEVIYHTYKGLMFRVANGILHNEHDAEDAVHHAFLKIIHILETINDPECHKTKGLVVIIVERIAIDLYRRKKRHGTVPLDGEWADQPGRSETELIAERAAIAEAIAALPTRQREVVLLKYDHGYSHREIAQILSMEETNVRKTLQRAKERLSVILQEQEI